ncbi:MAG: sensor histidine kinase, partial [Anaerolineales bacterium]|nr:sensor histidine kinase [Anaerolineales bacterium]
IRQRERAEGEADALNAIMQEMHHRIKNNLQTVADLLSLEMSRNPRPEVHESLRDSITRIKSIAASHEMLSVESVGVTDITELSRRVVETTRRSMVRSDQKIAVRVQGPDVYLGSKQATAFAIVLNELVANAIEHGFRERATGNIEIELDWDGSDVWMRVQDDGAGLPDGFDLKTSRGLGLQIARTLVEKDLRGRLALTRNTEGTTAWVLFQRGAALSNKE